MSEMNLQGLLDLGESEFARSEAEWMIVEVQVEDNLPEIIVNPKENFKTKLAYYGKAYDFDLKLKVNPNIRIINYGFAKNISEYFG